MTTLNDIAQNIADKNDVDPDYVTEALGIYLDQLNRIDGTSVEADDIPDDTREALETAYDAGAAGENVRADNLSSDLIEVCNGIAEAQNRIDYLTSERDHLMRQLWSEYGTSAKTLVDLTGLSTARVYAIIGKD